MALLRAVPVLNFRENLSQEDALGHLLDFHLFDIALHLVDIVGEIGNIPLEHEDVLLIRFDLVGNLLGLLLIGADLVAKGGPGATNAEDEQPDGDEFFDAKRNAARLWLCH